MRTRYTGGRFDERSHRRSTQERADGDRNRVDAVRQSRSLEILRNGIPKARELRHGVQGAVFNVSHGLRTHSRGEIIPGCVWRSGTLRVISERVRDILTKDINIKQGNQNIPHPTLSICTKLREWSDVNTIQALYPYSRRSRWQPS